MGAIQTESFGTFVSVATVTITQAVETSNRGNFIHHVSYEALYCRVLVCTGLCSSYACRILAQVCYKILEQSKDPKQKYMRNTIFEVSNLLLSIFHTFAKKKQTYCICAYSNINSLIDKDFRNPD